MLWDFADEDFETIVKGSITFAEIAKKCGYRAKTSFKPIKRRIELLNIDISHLTNRASIKPPYKHENIFCVNSKYSSMQQLKNKLLNIYKWKYECSICKISTWQNQKISLEIDHINGDNKDHRFCNLRFLCPNCHSQTLTYKGRNKQNINKKFCLDCSKKIVKTSIRCVSCNNKQKLKQKPETLEQDILELGFCGTGRKYGVTDNAIRKWCKQMGLPTRICDLKKN